MKEPAPSGFPATLLAAAAFEDPEAAPALAGLALREGGAIRRAALRFLLESKEPAAAETVVRGFALLGPGERAEAMGDGDRLVRAAAAVLSGPGGDARSGLLAFAASLPRGRGLGLLLPLLADPEDGTRAEARAALVTMSREIASGRSVPPGPVEASRFARALEAALRAAGAEDQKPLAAALVLAAGAWGEGRAALQALVGNPSHPARDAVIEALAAGAAPEAATAAVFLLAAGPAPAREAAASVVRARGDPEFLRELAREAAGRMESPSGIPRAAAEALAAAPWDSLRPEALRALPPSARRRLEAIRRQGLRAEAGRAARAGEPQAPTFGEVEEYLFPRAAWRQPRALEEASS